MVRTLWGMDYLWHFWSFGGETIQNTSLSLDKGTKSIHEDSLLKILNEDNPTPYANNGPYEWEGFLFDSFNWVSKRESVSGGLQPGEGAQAGGGEESPAWISVLWEESFQCSSVSKSKYTKRGKINKSTIPQPEELSLLMAWRCLVVFDCPGFCFSLMDSYFVS